MCHTAVFAKRDHKTKKIRRFKETNREVLIECFLFEASVFGSRVFAEAPIVWYQIPL